MINKIKIKYFYTNKIIDTDLKKKDVSTSYLSKIMSKKTTGDFIFLENGPEINVQNIEYSKKLRKKKQNEGLTIFSGAKNKKILENFGFKKNKINKIKNINKKIIYWKMKKIKYLKKKYRYIFGQKKYYKKMLNLRRDSKQIIIERPSRVIKIMFLLSTIFEKGVNIEKACVKRKSGNARILAKAIAHLCLNKNFRRVKKIVKKSIRVFLFTTEPNKIVGIKVTVNGRLKKGRITPRKTKNTFIIGRLKKCSKVNVSRVVAKNFKGQYSVTVKLAMI